MLDNPLNENLQFSNIIADLLLGNIKCITKDCIIENWFDSERAFCLQCALAGMPILENFTKSIVKHEGSPVVSVVCSYHWCNLVFLVPFDTM